MLQILYKKNIIIILSVIVIGITTFLIIKKTKENISLTNVSGFIGISDKSELVNIPNSDIKLKSLNKLPKGVIAMWSGDITKIPTGWYLCDGNNSTPDLRGRFIVGYNKPTSAIVKNYTIPNKDINGNDVTIKTYTINNVTKPEYNMKDIGGENIQIFSEEQMPKHHHNSRGKPNGHRGIGEANDNWWHFPCTDTQNKGQNKKNDNRPPYYALFYIIKISD
jgi:microcystin-dependent protein